MVCFGMLSVTAFPPCRREGSTRRGELEQDETVSVLECARAESVSCSQKVFILSSTAEEAVEAKLLTAEKVKQRAVEA